MKIIAAVLFVIVGAGAGMYKAEQLRGRHELLGQLIEGFSFMENEIIYTRERLDNVSRRVSDMTSGKAAVFFKDFSEALVDDQEKGTEELWFFAAEKHFGRSSPLSAKDVEAVASLGSRLGKTDVKGQCENIRRTVKELSIRRAEAWQDIEKKGRLYRTVGAAAGAACALLVI